MGPDSLCARHLDELDHLRMLADAIHADRLPGWYRELHERLGELITALETFSDCYRCCRDGDRLGELVCLLLREIYSEHMARTADRQSSRNLRRRAYDLRWLLRGLHAGPSVVLLGWSRPYGLELVPGSRLDLFLRRHDEDLSLIPASMSLSAFVAFQRGLEAGFWNSYAVTGMDETLLRAHGSSLRRRRFATRGVDWLAEHDRDRYPVLRGLGWVDTLAQPALDTLEVLLHGWSGSIDQLIDTSVSLS